jgi:hypothetical protein
MGEPYASESAHGIIEQMDKEAVHRYFKVTLSIVTSETVLTLIAIVQNHLYFSHHSCLEDKNGIVLDAFVVFVSLILFLASILGAILAIKVRNKQILLLFSMSFVFSIIIFFVMDLFVYYEKGCPPGVVK